MNNKYIDMSDQIFRNINSYNKRFFMFLFLVITTINTSSAQCTITPQDTTVCAGTTLNLYVDTTSTTSNLWTQLQAQASLPGFLNTSSFAFDKVRRKIYFVNTRDQVCHVYDVVTNSFSTIILNNWPSSSYSTFIYNPTTDKLQLFRGTDNVYEASPVANSSWTQTLSGSWGNIMNGANPFYNGVSGKVGVIHGYGFYEYRNWAFEENNGSWVQQIPNANTQPYKRNTHHLYPNSNYSKLYMIDGSGNEDGNQFQSSCNLGQAWASDVGVWCWLKDVWELDLATYQWTNILSLDDNTITEYGTNAYDYEANILYRVGGMVPSPVYQGTTPTTTDMYKLDLNNPSSGYSLISQSGDIPPATTDIGVTYYDDVNDLFLMFRNDGVWQFQPAAASGSLLWSTGDTTHLITVSPSQTTTYSVAVTDSSGSVCHDTVIITVLPEIIITANVTNPSSQTANNGNVTTLVTGGSGGFTYQWDTLGTILSQYTGPNALNLIEQTYCLSVTDNNGCSADSCFNVEWNPCGVSDSLISPVPCNGGQAMIEVEVDTSSNGTGPFSWNPIFQTRFEFSFYSVNPFSLVSTIPLNTPVANQFLSAGEYIVSVYDRSWQDSCFTDTIIITEPDPIIIYTTTYSVTLPGNNNGVINIDSITGGNIPYVTIDWYDQTGAIFASDTTLVDSLSYANDYTGGYQISVIDTNGCTGDTIIYLDPLNPEQTLDTSLSIFTQTTCFGYCDGSIFIEMEDVGNSSVPPISYVFMDFNNFGVYDTITLGHPYYNPNTHTLNYVNLCAGAYQIQTFDYYGNTGPVVEGIVSEPAQVQVDVGADFILRCGEDTVIAGDAAGGNILNDTILVSQNNLSWGTNATAFTDTLTAGKEYLLVVQGTYQDNAGNTYDAAYNVNTQAPANDWILGTGTTHRPTPDIFNVNNIYNFEFSGFNGVQQVVLPGGNFSGNLTFALYEISLDTTIYNWTWTTIPASNPAIVSNTDTVYVYPGINGTDYVLTLTDQLGCTGADTVNASWDLNILEIDNISLTHVGCNGSQTGSIAIVVDTSSGFPPYTYILDGNTTNDTTFNLSAGIYSVSLTDDIGCVSDTTIVEILENDSLYACMDLVNFVPIQVDQFVMTFDTAFSDTSVVTQLGLDYELVISGTFNDTLWVPYQDAAYSWNSASPNIGVAHADNPWSWNGTTNIRPNIDTYDPVNHTYTYNFVGDGTSQVFNYIDTYGDYFGSGGQLTFTLYKLVCPDSDTTYTCYGDSTGTATVYANGGVPFIDAHGQAYYQYQWIDNAGNIVDTNMTATGLSAGVHTVTVIDAVGCTYDRQIIVEEPTSPLVIDTTSNFANVLCYSDSTGSVTVYNSGGFSPYLCVLLLDNSGTLDTVQIISGDIDTLVFDNLIIGTYHYYLYDTMPDSIYGDYMPCPQTMHFTLTQPLELLSTASLIDHIDCWGDSTGQASVQAIGGVGPYTYNWTSIGDTTPITNNLFADTLLPFPNTTWHYVIVTDSNGCQRTDSVQIEHMYEKIRPFYINTSGVGVYEVNIIEDSVTCYGDCDGVAALSTVGGVLPHTYVWDVPAVNAPNYISNNQPDTVDWLCAGGHDIIVTDDVGCETTVRYQIEQPDQIYAIGTLTTPISCFGYDDGSAHVYGVGGNDISPASYTYTWQLDPNIYSSIDDSLFWLADTNNAGYPSSFAGDTNWLGALLNNQSAQQTDSILLPGIHIVTVTDYKGCFATDTVEFIEPTQLTIEIIDSLIVYAYCDNTESASLCAQAFGGTPNYTYQYNDDYHQNNVGNATGENNPFCAFNLTPYNTQTTANVPAGYYYVSVLDERGCFADDYIDIDSSTNTFNINSIQYTSQDVSCYNGTNGIIDIDTIFGGLGTFPTGYTITWTGPNGYSNNIPVISSLEAGNYALIVTDSSSPIPCQVTMNIPIVEPDQLLVTIYGNIGATCFPLDPNNFMNPPSAGSCDGQLMVDITGGTGPYRFDLDEAGMYPFTNFQSIPTPGDTLIHSLCVGGHTIYITDTNNCEGSVLPGGIATAVIDSGVIVTAEAAVTQLPSCSNSDDAAAEVVNPNSIFDYSWQTNSGFPAGPSGNILGTGNSYNSFYGGDYWLVASYAPSSNFGLPIPGCDAIDLVSILTPQALSYTYNYIAPLCWGDANGEVQITNISGGTAPYTITWDTTVSLPNGFTSTFPLPGVNPPSILLAGTYTFTIIDANGCELTDSIVLLQPDQIQVNFITESASCNGGIDGVIQVQSISGGVFNPAPNNSNFTWNPNLTPLGTPNDMKWEGSAGTYNVVVTDGQGCTVNSNVVIAEPDPIQVTLDPEIFGVDAAGNNIHVSCFGSNDGSLTTSVTGGNGGYTYSIGATNNTNGVFTGLAAGTITVDVEDSKGCQGQASIIYNSPSAVDLDLEPLVNAWGNNISCKGGSDGSIFTTVSGGIPNNNGTYNYSWSNGASSQNITGLTAGIYTCIVTDANGCSQTDFVELIQPDYTFEADVITTNYGGPGNETYTVNFLDQTTDGSGGVSTLSHSFCWNYSVVFNETIQEYVVSCNDSSYYPNTGYGSEFTHDFEGIGSHDIFVRVTNTDNGCTDTVEFIIDVQGLPDPPNMFSPNGDLINDEFSFGEFGMDEMNVEIFNRWGEKVYSWQGENKSWNGNGVDGDPLPEGVYFYVVQATGQDGFYYEKKGTVTLMR